MLFRKQLTSALLHIVTAFGFLILSPVVSYTRPDTRSSGALNKEEIDEAIADGCLNGLFVMARTIGLIGHFLDQKRMKQPLYRHPWDDITYVQ